VILGRSVITWIILVFVAICVFILAKWLIPLLFGLIGFTVPDQIATILALLIALGCVFGGYSYRRIPAA
jgi:hypothetical protein